MKLSPISLSGSGGGSVTANKILYSWSGAHYQLDEWLAGSAGLEALKPWAQRSLQSWPVSKRVNSSRAPDDDATLIEEIAA